MRSLQESPSISGLFSQPQDCHQHRQSRKRQRSRSSSAEHESWSNKDRFASLNSINDVAAEYCAHLTAVSGVKIPSKRGPLHKPLQPSHLPKSNDLTCFCPVCGAGYVQRTEVWSHFVACVALNGNPNGACWDDEIGTGYSKLLQPSERTIVTKANLDAVNGVVIPSKLAEGELPAPANCPQSTTPGHIACPICTSLFSRRDHLKSHFPACVKRNGNPNGLKWDHGLPVLKRGPIALPRQPKQAPLAQQARQARQPSSQRAIKSKNRLDSVNGIIIPSKLADEQLPLVLPSQAKGGTPALLSCPRCQSRFVQKDHVRSHFPACVDRNGNPDGVRWDDGLPKLSRGPKAT